MEIGSGTLMDLEEDHCDRRPGRGSKPPRGGKMLDTCSVLGPLASGSNHTVALYTSCSLTLSAICACTRMQQH